LDAPGEGPTNALRLTEFVYQIVFILSDRLHFIRSSSFYRIVFMECGMTQRGTDRGSWPDLPYPAWRETCTTLHLWTQIVGKIRLSQTPWLNHSWHVTLYLTSRGLTTSPIPYGERAFQVDFDFIDHALRIDTSGGPRWQMPLHAKSVADFHAAIMAALADVGIEVHIDEIPNELPDPIRFSEDRVHAAYDAEYAQRFLIAFVFRTCA
jgi:hypothetical protein